MPGARVESVDALRRFRAALIKFAEAANTALGDADSQIRRTITWLETEQRTRWQGEVRKRSEIVMRCKEAVRQKKLFKDASGRTPSAAQEEKDLKLAQRRLEEAEQRLANTLRWARRMPREAQNYQGGVARLLGSIASDLPAAVARLDRMVAALEAYLAVAAEGEVGPAGRGSVAEPAPPDPHPDGGS